MNKQESLQLIIDTIKEHRITAYEISQATNLSSVGVQKIINGETKNPNQSTIDTILLYLERNIVGTNYREGEKHENKTAEPDLTYFKDPFELLTAYKKQIWLFEKNMDLYEENAGLYRENSDLLREKVRDLKKQFGVHS